MARAAGRQAVSDEDVQTARRLLASGDRDGRVSLLEAMHRSGDQVQVTLVRTMAYVGDRDARTVRGTCTCPCGWTYGTMMASGRPIGPDVDHVDSRDFQTWVQGLAPLDHGCQHVLAIAGAMFVLREWSRGHACDGTGRAPRLNHMDNTPTGEYGPEACSCCHGAHRVVDLAQAWVDDPTDERAQAWGGALRAAWSRADRERAQATPWMALGGPTKVERERAELRWLPGPPWAERPPSTPLLACQRTMYDERRLSEAVRQAGAAWAQGAVR